MVKVTIVQGAMAIAAEAASEAALHVELLNVAVALFALIVSWSKRPGGRSGWPIVLPTVAFLASLLVMSAAVLLDEPAPELRVAAVASTLVLGLYLVFLTLGRLLSRIPWRRVGLASSGLLVLLLTTAALAQVGHDHGLNIPKSGYRTVPAAPRGFEGLNTSKLAIVVCRQALAGKPPENCELNAQDAVPFRLHSVLHVDNRGGADYWDYNFLAPSGEWLIYRKNPSQSSHWGIVRGKTDENVDFSQNKVAGLEDLGDTALAQNVLEPQADDLGMKWAQRGGVSTSTRVAGSGLGSPGELPLALAGSLLLVLVTLLLIPIAISAVRRIGRAGPGAPAERGAGCC